MKAQEELSKAKEELDSVRDAEAGSMHFVFDIQRVGFRLPSFLAF